MLLKANRKIATATNIPPAFPTSSVRACCVSCTPFTEPSNGAPLNRMIKAVQVQISRVSVKTPRVWINPCLTGCVTDAVAATFGADPIPASLLNRPRLIPCIRAAPIVPPAACSHPKALLTISLMTAGSSVILNSTIPEASATYPNAITGTITLLTLAIRWIPPKIMVSVSTVSTAPTILGSKPNEPCMAAQIVLLCTELNAKPKVTEIKMANSMPIQFSPNPYRI